jgi:hypothetical protein
MKKKYGRQKLNGVKFGKNREFIMDVGNIKISTLNTMKNWSLTPLTTLKLIYLEGIYFHIKLINMK